jgi:hypothetical protein
MYFGNVLTVVGFEIETYVFVLCLKWVPVFALKRSRKKYIDSKGIGIHLA